MDKVMQYCIKNHDKYGIHNEKGELLSEQEMKELLLILDLFGENLDTFHDVQYQGYTDFCGVVGERFDDNDTYKSIVDFHNYIKQSDVNRFMYDLLDNYTYCQEKELQSIEDFKEDFVNFTLDELDIVEGGLVHHIYC